jgi:hypothetical protein
MGGGRARRMRLLRCKTLANPGIAGREPHPNVPLAFLKLGKQPLYTSTPLAPRAAATSAVESCE